MKHFLFEFITGGGLLGQTLPDSLVCEGRIMVKTILKELIACGHTEITITKDQRLKSFSQNIIEHDINASIEETLPDIIRKSNISWLIAPETSNCLYDLTNIFLKNSRLFIGSNLNAVKIASSKRTTYDVLKNANINTPNTVFLNEKIPNSNYGWIIKPDDGVGAENCIYIHDAYELKKKILTKEVDNYVIQPFIDGEHMSMSLFVYNKNVQLLSCNKQEIIIQNNVIKLTGIVVNEYLSYAKKMRELATEIVSVIPGLSGYVGVDLIRKNNIFFVVDINPRFTTSYAGLSASLGVNITEKIVETFMQQKIQDISLTKAIPIKLKL